jgi:hypothetical protein
MSATYITPTGEQFKRGDARKAGYPITQDAGGWYLDARERQGWARHYSTEREALSAAWNAIQQDEYRDYLAHY